MSCRNIKSSSSDCHYLCATPSNGLQLAPPNLPAGTNSMALLERERCLADLGEWLGAAANGGGCIALLGGEAGVGKSSLLHEFSNRYGHARVLWGACDALFTPRPLSPLHDIARQTRGALSAVVNSGASREEIFSAALDELERTAALVVFEDMHWADEATLDLLKYLGRRIHRTHAMLVVTYRDDEVGPRHPLTISSLATCRAKARAECRSLRFRSPLLRSSQAGRTAVKRLARHHGRQPALCD